MRRLLTLFLACFLVPTCTACGLEFGLYGNRGPVELAGLPVDQNQVEQVYAYVQQNGSAVLGVYPHTDYLKPVTEITFVPQVFTCDPNVYGATECLGITHIYDDGHAESKVVLRVADFGQEPTNNVGCTALAHELTHVLSWQATGDPDPRHVRVELWGKDGIVANSLRHFCPEWVFTPNDYNAPN